MHAMQSTLQFGSRGQTLRPALNGRNESVGSYVSEVSSSEPSLIPHCTFQAAAGFWKFPALLLSLVHLFVHGFCRLTLGFLGLCGIAAMSSSRTLVCAMAGPLLGFCVSRKPCHRKSPSNAHLSPDSSPSESPKGRSIRSEMSWELSQESA